jgi:hypothetical protein
LGKFGVVGKFDGVGVESIHKCNFCAVGIVGSMGLIRTVGQQRIVG